MKDRKMRSASWARATRSAGSCVSVPVWSMERSSVRASANETTRQLPCLRPTGVSVAQVRTRRTMSMPRSKSSRMAKTCPMSRKQSTRSGCEPRFCGLRQPCVLTATSSLLSNKRSESTTSGRGPSSCSRVAENKAFRTKNSACSMAFISASVVASLTGLVAARASQRRDSSKSSSKATYPRKICLHVAHRHQPVYRHVW
mmetsp:Transcript_5464/g.22649  ORF Transcript_5464/g.22649 Transcript_5464/m.22649 type:complete len:200 (-) Transcript_5464:418-1017(-)